MKLIDAFRDRVYGYYLEPAKSLNSVPHGFGCGLLCAATIDLLARPEYAKYDESRKEDVVKGKDYIKWLKGNIKDFAKEDYAERFYKYFRCGLVHEGRIKELGQFSYDKDGFIFVEGDVTIIHPEKLLDKIEEAFQMYMDRLEKDQTAYSQFRDRLAKDFKEEVDRAKRMP